MGETVQGGAQGPNQEDPSSHCEPLPQRSHLLLLLHVHCTADSHG